MKTRNYFFLLLIIVFGACSTKISSNIINSNPKKLSPNETIYVFDLDEDIPENATSIGSIKIDGRGLPKNCTYEKLIYQAQQEARSSNANIVKITKLESPDFIKSCYSIEASLYQIDSLIQFSSLPDSANYSLIHFFRPDSFFGSLRNFDIKDAQGNKLVMLKNNSKFTYKVTKFGKNVFWAPNVGDKSISINVVKGQEYYVNCRMVQTYMGSDKIMDLERNKKGKKMFDSVKNTQE